MNNAVLERRLGYAFSAASLLAHALTHRSHSAQHNERLEFLGDSVLGLVISRALYTQFPAMSEGDLSRLRANLVKRETLCEIALELQLSDFLQLGEGELRSGGASRPSILADTLEAILGAVLLDAGFDRVEQTVLALYGTRLQQLDPNAEAKDSKTRLQEYLQGRRMKLPEYRVISTQGEAHAQQFIVECVVTDLKLKTFGEGSSRRVAEQIAAQRTLEAIPE